MEKLFGVIPFCLDNLVTQEVSKLNVSRLRSSAKNGVVTDPTDDVVRAVGSLLTWYQSMHTVPMTAEDIEDCFTLAMTTAKLLKQTFPERNKCPKKIISGEDLGDREVLQWEFPKFHALMHCHTSVYLYGAWANCSTCSLEQKHCSIKEAAKLCNGKPGCSGWLLQVMQREKAEHEARGRAGGTPVLSQVGHSTFSDNLNASGLKFPVLQCIKDWKDISRYLKVQFTDEGTRTRRGVVVYVIRLQDDEYYWRLHGPELRNLPHFLAEYVRDKVHGKGQWSKIPGPGDEKVTLQQKRDLLSECVHSQNNWARGCGRGRPTHVGDDQGMAGIVPMKSLCLTHPKLKGSIHDEK
jgi:hypothetical protein